MDIISNKTRWIPYFFWVIFPFDQFVQSVEHPRSTPRHHTLLTSLRISQVRPRKMCLLFGYLVLNVENGGNDSSFLWLVVWNMAFICFYDFPYIGNVIIPTDELIFFRAVGIPPYSKICHFE